MLTRLIVWIFTWDVRRKRDASERTLHREAYLLWRERENT